MLSLYFSLSRGNQLKRSSQRCRGPKLPIAHNNCILSFFFFSCGRPLQRRCERSSVGFVNSDTTQQQQRHSLIWTSGPRKKECSGFKASPGVAAVQAAVGGESHGAAGLQASVSTAVNRRTLCSSFLLFLSFLSFCHCFKQSAMAYMVCCGPEIRRRKQNNVFLFFEGEGHAWLITE